MSRKAELRKRAAGVIVIAAESAINREDSFWNKDDDKKEIAKLIKNARLEISWADDNKAEFSAHIDNLIAQRIRDLS